MLTIATRLVAILTSLRQAVAAFAARQTHVQSITWIGAQAFRPIEAPNQPPRLPAETWSLLHLRLGRLGRLAARFAALFARWQANTLPIPRARTPRPSTPRPSTPPPSSPSNYQRLPASRGCINLRIPEAAPCGGMIHILLQEPELPRFLAAAPQAGRLLRPLLRALGLDAPDCLKLPPRPPRTRPRSHRPQLQPTDAQPDRPLPAYVRAAARAWKKYDR